MENPIITIKSTSTDWKDLGMTEFEPYDRHTIKVPFHLGRMEIDTFLRIDVETITEDTIIFRGGDYNYLYELHKGGNAVCVTHTVGGYTDHDGCDWDGTDYDYFLSWE